MSSVRLPFAALIVLAAASLTPAQDEAAPARAEVGSHAPTFRLMTDDGERLNTADLRGRRNLLLAFYPRDFTPG